jgi:hypothetical protein
MKFIRDNNRGIIGVAFEGAGSPLIKRTIFYGNSALQNYSSYSEWKFMASAYLTQDVR